MIRVRLLERAVLCVAVSVVLVSCCQGSTVFGQRSDVRAAIRCSHCVVSSNAVEATSAIETASRKLCTVPR